MQSYNPPRLADMHPSLGASLSGTNLERAGDHNQRVTLQAIRVSGPVTRADLAEITGLTAPAIANITKRLLKDGLILEAGRLTGQRGQPAMKLAINPDGCFSVGLNIDRDHVTLVVLDLMGQVRARASHEVQFALPGTVTAFFQKELEAILAEGDIKADRVIGIGVALPDDLGRISLPNQPAGYEAWNNTDIADLVGGLLPVPVYLENDASAAALGELQFGHGLHHPSFVYILISRGLGGGLVIDGHYYRGADGRSGEIGFMPIRPTTPDRPIRTLQDAVSLSALFAFLQARGCPLDRPDQLAGLDADGRAIVREWIDQAADHLIDPMLAISCLINPEAVFLGGRLPVDIVDALCNALNRRLDGFAGMVPTMAPVQRAAMAADAPAVGAAILPFNHRLLPSQSVLRKTAEE
ncbi:ROK family transcriptional regulator [Niveispirillum irakense]|uniref:ROK family transcriptional regulator n=1 Tax=Niveispirillum irakense TaxID=34011 RepID=UPI00041F67E1|nr:ROK family transcriptional regulator [Niveispirillum irakense]